MSALSEQTRRALLQAHLDRTTDEPEHPDRLSVMEIVWVTLGWSILIGLGLAFWIFTP